jgi:hypothetical protein
MKLEDYQDYQKNNVKVSKSQLKEYIQIYADMAKKLKSEDAVELEAVTELCKGINRVGCFALADDGVFCCHAENGLCCEISCCYVHLVVDLSRHFVTLSVCEVGNGCHYYVLCIIGVKHELSVLNLVLTHIDGVGVHTGRCCVAGEYLLEGMLKPKVKA